MYANILSWDLEVANTGQVSQAADILHFFCLCIWSGWRKEAVQLLLWFRVIHDLSLLRHFVKSAKSQPDQSSLSLGGTNTLFVPRSLIDKWTCFHPVRCSAAHCHWMDSNAIVGCIAGSCYFLLRVFTYFNIKWHCFFCALKKIIAEHKANPSLG